MKVRYLFLLLLIPIISSAQIMDCPNVMVVDSLNGASARVVRDFYFNVSNDSSYREPIWYGTVDWDCHNVVTSTLSLSDTMIVEAYGIKLKIQNGATEHTACYIDSHRVASIPISNTMTFADSSFSYPIDPLWTNFSHYDGIRIVLKNSGSDADSSRTQHNLRINKDEERPF